MDMRVIALDVVMNSRAIRIAALEDLGRAVWVAMVALLTGDARVIAEANRRVGERLSYALFIERIFGRLDAELYD